MYTKIKKRRLLNLHCGLKGNIYMINIAICEDNEEELARIHNMLCQSKIPCEFKKYTNAEPLLLDIETNKKQFDIFLMDIYLPGQNGIEAARRIRESYKNAVIIFMTTSEDFYREAFDLYAFHYLIKPVSLTKLTEVLQKALDQIASPNEMLQITFRGQNIMLRHSDIAYINSSGHTMCFNMLNGQQYTSYGRLDEIQTQLTDELFVRCHKSFIVNLIHVNKLTREGFYIGDTLIPISRTYAAVAKESYRRRLFGIFQDS